MFLNISASRRTSFPSHLQPPASSENSANTLWDKLAVHLGALSSFYLQWTLHGTTKALLLSLSYNCFLFLPWPSSELTNILRIQNHNKYPQESKRSKILSSLWKNTFISGILFTVFFFFNYYYHLLFLLFILLFCNRVLSRWYICHLIYKTKTFK